MSGVVLTGVGCSGGEAVLIAVVMTGAFMSGVASTGVVMASWRFCGRIWVTDCGLERSPDSSGVAISGVDKTGVVATGVVICSTPVVLPPVISTPVITSGVVTTDAVVLIPVLSAYSAPSGKLPATGKMASTGDLSSQCEMPPVLASRARIADAGSSSGRAFSNFMVISDCKSLSVVRGRLSASACGKISA